jgi:hypothetical protein
MSKYNKEDASSYGEWRYDPILQKYKCILGLADDPTSTPPTMQEILYESAITLASGKDGELIISEECKEILRRYCTG